MLHNWHDAYGFVIESDGQRVGFSGDSAMCNNVRKILKTSQAAFLDSSNVEPNNKHLSASEIISLSKEFSSCKIIPVHLTYRSRALLEKEIEIPKEGKEYIFKKNSNF